MITTELWCEVVANWLGEPVVMSEVHELRNWSQSQVLRITVTAGGIQRVIYAKQARAEHAREATIYQLAGQVDGFPAPQGRSIAIDGEAWLLIKQAAGEQLSRCRDISLYHDAVKGLAAFHQQSLEEQWLDQITGFDHLVQRVGGLADSAIAIAQARAAEGVFTEFDRTLAVEVHAQLTKRWPVIHDELARYPQSLIHGDCHSGNIFIQDARIQFVDWGTAAVAPGLLDLVGLLDVAARMKDGIGSHEALKELYWAQLSAEARQRYGSLARAYQVLRIVRSLFELDWFSHTDDDYGGRASRELAIVSEALTSLV